MLFKFLKRFRAYNYIKLHVSNIRKIAFFQIIFSYSVIGLAKCFEKYRNINVNELEKHKDYQNRIWVSYKGKVYDISEFVEVHPGGKVILEAAGQDLEYFFEKYSFHQKEEILNILENYYIGEIGPKCNPNINNEKYDEFKNEPKRDSSLIVNSNKPFNAETPLDRLCQNYYTRNDIFFVRNHMPVPDINIDSHKISICAQKKYLTNNKNLIIEIMEIERGKSEIFYCKDYFIKYMLENFKEHTIDCTLQCTGNRRDEMNKIKKVMGLGWRGGAIGNAKWSGVKIHDVLLDFGVNTEDIACEHSHVRIIGADINTTDEHYEASIPFRFANQSDSIFAFKMNEEILSRDHGFPVRAIIPGITGARNVKWIEKVVIAEKESQSRWQQEDYRAYSPDKFIGSKFKIDVPAIQEMPVTSLICTPSDKGTVETLIGKDGKYFIVKGYAYSGGGHGISRVEISIDGGASWKPAKLGSKSDVSYKIYSWNLWEAEVNVPIDQTEIEIICKAVDTSYNHQPESALPIWNMRGLLNNTWHKIKLKLT